MHARALRVIDTWPLPDVTYTKTRLYSQSDVPSKRVYCGIFQHDDIRLVSYCLNIFKLLLTLTIYNNLPSGNGNTSSVRASPLNNPMAKDCKSCIKIFIKTINYVQSLQPKQKLKNESCVVEPARKEWLQNGLKKSLCFRF